MVNEVNFSQMAVEINGVVVAKITAFARVIAIAETDVTGSNNTFTGLDVYNQQFVSINIGKKANIEGIAIESADGGKDEGQSDLKVAAESGKTVILTQVRNTGYGKIMTGFFSGYTETGLVSGAYKFSGTFTIKNEIDVKRITYRDTQKWSGSVEMTQYAALYPAADLFPMADLFAGVGTDGGAMGD